MSEPDEPSDAVPGPTLSSDGTLEGRLNRVEPASPASFEAPTDERLELNIGAPPPLAPLPMQVLVTPPSRRWPLRFVVGSMGLGLLILAVALVRRPVSEPEPDTVRPLGTAEVLLGGPSHRSAIIQTEPSGAQIVFNGRVIGTTPWAGDQTFGAQPIELRLSGYRTWSGPLPDRDDAVLKVKLSR